MFKKTNKYKPSLGSLTADQILEDMNTFKIPKSAINSSISEILEKSNISHDEWWTLYEVFNTNIESLKDVTLALEKYKKQAIECNLEHKESSKRVIEEIEGCIEKIKQIELS